MIGTAKKRINVRNLTPNITDTLVYMLQNDRPGNVFQEVHSLSFASTLAYDASGKQTDLHSWLQTCLQACPPGDQKPPRRRPDNCAFARGPVVWKVNPDDDASCPDLVWYIAHKSLTLEDRCIRGSTPTSTCSMSSILNAGCPIPMLTPSHPTCGGPVGQAPGRAGDRHTIWRLLSVNAPSAALGEETLRGFLTSRRKSVPGFRFLCPHPHARRRLERGPDQTRTSPAIPNEAEERERQGSHVWNLNIVNDRDPVPQAWAYPKQNLSNVYRQFPQHLADLVKRAVETILQVLLDKKPDFTPLQSQISCALSSLEGVLPQHSEGYHDYIGIVPPLLTVALGG
ncbi:hypothetical protein JVU11DRAFT_3875 [Chiua virens]|nr:hypothetical protein JVU11DRAFT_3875 [Chiua virens]